MSSSIIKIRRRKESDLHVSFFIEGNSENLKRLQYYYYYHLYRVDNNYDNDDNNNNNDNNNRKFISINDNDDSFQFIKGNDDDYNLCMINNDKNRCYECHENNCNQLFNTLIKVIILYDDDDDYHANDNNGDYTDDEYDIDILISCTYD